MGTYTDFFIASEDDLRRAFVGWKRPLPEPTAREAHRPKKWVADPADEESPEPFAGKTLGQRLARFPTVDEKNLDPSLLGDLVAIALGDERWRERYTDGSDRPPLVPTDGDDSHMLAELPAAFVAAVAAWTDDDARRAADEWATAELNDWLPEDCFETLKALRDLAARGQREKKRLYYWM